MQDHPSPANVLLTQSNNKSGGIFSIMKTCWRKPTCIKKARSNDQNTADEISRAICSKKFTNLHYPSQLVPIVEDVIHQLFPECAYVVVMRLDGLNSALREKVENVFNFHRTSDANRIGSGSSNNTRGSARKRSQKNVTENSQSIDIGPCRSNTLLIEKKMLEDTDLRQICCVNMAEGKQSDKLVLHLIGVSPQCQYPLFISFHCSVFSTRDCSLIDMFETEFFSALNRISMVDVNNLEAAITHSEHVPNHVTSKIGMHQSSEFDTHELLSLTKSSVVLTSMIERITQAILCDSCSVHVFDPKQQEWRTELSHYPKLEQSLIKPRWQLDEEITGTWFTDTKSTEFPINSSNGEQNNSTSFFRLCSGDFCLPIMEPRALIQFHSEDEISSQINNAKLVKDLVNYCSISMTQFHQLRTNELLINRVEMLEELLSRHMVASDHDVHELRTQIESKNLICPPNFNQFNFIPRNLADPESVNAVISIFDRLGFVHRWQIPTTNLVQFVLTVQRNYRRPAYHNWTHAFCVGHFAFLCMHIAASRLSAYLDEMELFALLVGTLCHDIDHRGMNNDYQRITESVFAGLYGHDGSLLEQHHVDHTLRILSTDGCNIFVNLDSSDRNRARSLIRVIILATDLRNHIQLKPTLGKLVRDGYDPQNEQHHRYLLSLLATASDLSDQSKPWKNTRVAASEIYAEFFEQGERERAFGRVPVESMDAQKACIPQLQINFLKSIVIPCYQFLVDIIPECNPTLVAVQKNREIWIKMLEKYRAQEIDGHSTEALFAGELDHHVEQILNVNPEFS